MRTQDIYDCRVKQTMWMAKVSPANLLYSGRLSECLTAVTSDKMPLLLSMPDREVDDRVKP